MAILTEITSLDAQQSDLQRTIQQLSKQHQVDHVRTGEASSIAGDYVRRTYHEHLETPKVERAPGFGEMLEGLVKGVDAKNKHSKQAVQDIILGKSDNIHEATVAMQEAGVAFNLMLEVRNKLTDSYQTLLRMSV
jgi:flagellar hook-basal body complex protein FliE